MDVLFLKLLNMSITAGYFVLGILLLRLLVPKIPKWIFVLLWGLVALRLLLPVSIESKQSLIPSTNTFPQQILFDPHPTIQSGIPALNSAVNPIVTEVLTPQGSTSTTPAREYATVASIIWVLGMGLMTGYSLFSYLRLRHSLREAIVCRGNIWLCDRLPSPFLLGLFRPRIYIPSDLNEEDLPYVLAHEEAHIKRKDHWWKPLGYLLLTVYWFHPLLWPAYILLCRDIEGACDEKVLRTLGREGKKPYSQALLRCSIPKRRLSVCPLAFGEGNLKGRISAVLAYKKPTLLVLALALVATAVLSLCFLTDPPKDASSDALSDTCWFDLLESEAPAEEVILSRPVPGHPQLRLGFRNTYLALIQGGEEKPLFYNHYIFNAFFMDLNDDGSVELCCSGFPYLVGEHLNPGPTAFIYDFVSGECHNSRDVFPGTSLHFAMVNDRISLCDAGYISDFISTLPTLSEELSAYLSALREAYSATYCEPLLYRDLRVGKAVFAYRLDNKLYPFYLTWEGKLLSEMDDRELTEFLLQSVPDITTVTEAQLTSARSMIRYLETDPSVLPVYSSTTMDWYAQVYRAVKAYYGASVSDSLPFQTETLTLQAVVELSRKGRELTWEDLHPYKATDIGSGLYIMEYPIDDRYSLICSDGKITGTPMRVILTDSHTGLSMDIRDGKVEVFLSPDSP